MRITGVHAGHVRFGFSVAREGLRAIEVLLHPQQRAEQMPWVRAVRPRIPRELRKQIEEFAFFFTGQAEVFPFLWPDAAMHGFDEELRVLRTSAGAYCDAVVRRISGKALLKEADLRRMRRRSWLKKWVPHYMANHPRSRAMLEAFMASPTQSLTAFANMLEQVHLHVLEPTWGSIEARLRDDIAMRKAILRKYGIAALLRTLSAQISVQRIRDGAAFEFGPGNTELQTDANSTIVLTPSFFTWPQTQAFALHTPRGLRSTIAYPIPPLPMRAPPVSNRHAVMRTCGAIADPIRMRILELLAARDLSTRELSGFLKLAEPIVSRHLRVLLDASLIEKAQRSGYFVLYRLRRDSFRLTASALDAFANGLIAPSPLGPIR